jgi:hypothetical protein
MKKLINSKKLTFTEASLAKRWEQKINFRHCNIIDELRKIISSKKEEKLDSFLFNCPSLVPSLLTLSSLAYSRP